MRRSPRLLLSFALLCASAASGGTVSILPFTGPKPEVPRDQLVQALCATQSCVPQAKVSKQGRPDWPKVRKEKVDVVLVGAVVGTPAKRFLQIEAFDQKGTRLWRERLELARNGKLSRSGVDAVSAHFEAALEVAPRPTEKKPRVDEAPKDPPPEKDTSDEGLSFKTAPPLGRDEGEGDGDGEDATVSVKPKDGARPGPVRRGPARPMIVAAAGADFVNRNFQYVDLRAPNLRSYETRPVLFAPRLHLEAYPVARILEGIPAGLGLELDFLFSIGLRSIDENDVAYPTTVNSGDLAARLNFWPKEGLDLMVAPIIGYRGATFHVGAATDGTELAGLPTINYIGLTFGGEVEYVALGRIVLFARLRYIHLAWLGEIGGEEFFPSSGGNALEGQGGGGYRILENLEARVLFHYTAYGLRFQPAEGATYLASGATDRYTGAAVMARFTY